MLARNDYVFLLKHTIIKAQLHNVGYSCVEVRMKREHGENPWSAHSTVFGYSFRFKSLGVSLGRQRNGI